MSSEPTHQRYFRVDRTYIADQAKQAMTLFFAPFRVWDSGTMTAPDRSRYVGFAAKSRRTALSSKRIMPDNPWDSADMAIVAMRLTQNLTGLMVNKGLITHDELKSVYDQIEEGLRKDASATNALAYLRAITPAALK